MRAAKKTAAAVDSVDLRAIAREVAPLVLAEIARLAGQAAQAEFFSTRRGEGPQWLPDSEWKALAPALPGAFKPSKGARWIFVPRESVDAYRRSLELARQGAPVVDLPRGTWHPAEAAEALRRRAGSR